MGALCSFRSGSAPWFFAFSSDLTGSPLSERNGPSWLSAKESVLKMGALCNFRSGSDSWSSPCPGHLTGSPLFERNDPNLLSARNSFRRWELCAAFAAEVHPGVPPVLLTSPEVIYPSVMTRIGFQHGIRPEDESSVQLPHRK